MGCQTFQQDPREAQMLQTKADNAFDSWKYCANRSAIELSISKEVPSDVAEAALGKCLSYQSAFQRATTEQLISEVSTLQAKQLIYSQIPATINDIRSDLKSSLITTVIEARMSKESSSVKKKKK